MRRIAEWALLAGSLLLIAGCGSSGSGGGGGGSPADSSTSSSGSDVAFSGSMGGPQTAGFHTLAADLSIYTLYCVTFTTPASSGSGQFDALGNFTLTIQGAAGQPVGCFIVSSADNSIVTTLTFVIGDPSGMGDGTSGSASFPAGNHTFTITFDPVTMTATADVSGTAGPTSGGDTGTFDPAALAGSWVIHCAPLAGGGVGMIDPGGHDGNPDDGGDGGDEHHGCAVDGTTVFLDVVQAQVDGQPVYAMGAWPDQATFVAAGKTEGMATPPAGVTAITSLIPASILTGADPAAKFTGFTQDTPFDYATLTLPASDAWDFLNGGSVLADLDWTSGGHVDGGCATTLAPNPTPGSWPASPSADQKKCLTQYMDRAAKNDAAFPSHYFIPAVDRHASWDTFVNGTSESLTFRGTKVANTPAIRSRIGLLGLQLAGNTAIASDSSADSHDEDGHASFESHHTNLVLVINADGSVTGWFSSGETDDDPAESQPEHSFQVTFTRP
jgi:hypothetical protein